MRSAANCVPLNLESGLPTAEAALVRLRGGLATLRGQGVKYVRVIHGYGSTGAGGAIRSAARAYLLEQSRNDRIRGYVPGERLGPADAGAVALAARFPALRTLPDWNAGNPGVSLVVL